MLQTIFRLERAIDDRQVPHEIMMVADKMLVPVVGTARRKATASYFGHMSVMALDKSSAQKAQYLAHIIIVVYIMRMKTRKQAVEHPITNLERLAAELRKIRRGRKVSQQELSDRAMVARRTITNAEGAENVGVKELCRIASGLGYELVLRPKNTVVFEELSATFKDDE